MGEGSAGGIASVSLYWRTVETPRHSSERPRTTTQAARAVRLTRAAFRNSAARAVWRRVYLYFQRADKHLRPATCRSFYLALALASLLPSLSICGSIDGGRMPQLPTRACRLVCRDSDGCAFCGGLDRGHHAAGREADLLLPALPVGDCPFGVEPERWQWTVPIPARTSLRAIVESTSRSNRPDFEP